MLLGLLGGNDVPERITLPTRLVHRRSTAPARTLPLRATASATVESEPTR
jgi:hypothetical protein